MVSRVIAEIIVHQHAQVVQHHQRVADVLTHVAQDALAVRLPHLALLVMVLARVVAHLDVVVHVLEPRNQPHVQIARPIVLADVHPDALALVEITALQLALVTVILLVLVYVRDNVEQPVVVAATKNA